MEIYRRGSRGQRLEKCTMQVRQEEIGPEQMYLVLEQSVRTMPYLRVRRKNRECFGGGSFRRIESTDSWWIRASVVYCRPENKKQ